MGRRRGYRLRVTRQRTLRAFQTSSQGHCRAHSRVASGCEETEPVRAAPTWRGGRAVGPRGHRRPAGRRRPGRRRILHRLRLMRAELLPTPGDGPRRLGVGLGAGWAWFWVAAGVGWQLARAGPGVVSADSSSASASCRWASGWPGWSVPAASCGPRGRWPGEAEHRRAADDDGRLPGNVVLRRRGSDELVRDVLYRAGQRTRVCGGRAAQPRCCHCQRGH